MPPKTNKTAAIWNINIQESVMSSKYPEIALPKTPAIIPKVEATPTRVPVELGAISA